MNHSEQRKKFRAVLAGSKCLSPASVYDPLSARIAEAVGYEIAMLAGCARTATVRAIADEIVVMYQGRVVQQGLKTEVLSPPHPAYTELLLSSVPEMRTDWLEEVLSKRVAA